VYVHQKGFVTFSTIAVVYMDMQGVNVKIQHAMIAIQQFVQVEVNAVFKTSVPAMQLTLETYVNTQVATESIQRTQKFVLEKELVKLLINVFVKLDTQEINVNLLLVQERILQIQLFVQH
jgi:hypothetical protein